MLGMAKFKARIKELVKQAAGPSPPGNSHRLWAGKSGCVQIGYSYNHGVVGGLEASPSAPAMSGADSEVQPCPTKIHKTSLSAYAKKTRP
jgi:hypothetical protein